MKFLPVDFQPILIFFSIFMAGAIVGSFLNVCIYRIPLGLSVVFPPSHCKKCNKSLYWYHNIPIISFILLRGRCAFCGEKYSWRYPGIEILNAVLYCLVFYYWRYSLETLVLLLFVSLLVVVTFIDFDHQIIPDIITYPGIIVGFFCSFLIPSLHWLDSIFGVLIGGGCLLVIAYCYELIAKKEGMGGGDIKLLAMIGSFCGWQAILPVVFIGSLLGTLVGVPLMFFRKKDSTMALPFGPFLAFGALIYVFWGRGLIWWYFNLFTI
nr:prepilin peptidase [uncultured Desulfuromonas sp.]